MKGCVLLCVVLVSVVVSFPSQNGTRISRRIHIPALGLGPECRGCPDHYCDDNPAIIQGYCCGCARFFGEPDNKDDLPVQCSTRIECPLNGHGLCEDYEYMMYCCC